MAADQPYPIHPTLDQLIQAFKEFQHEPFPRGMPQPLETWKPLLQHMTRFDAAIAKAAHEYLGGRVTDLASIKTPEPLKQSLAAAVTRSHEAATYHAALCGYLKKIETIAFLIEDCAAELGNPCAKFKA